MKSILRPVVAGSLFMLAAWLSTALAQAQYMRNPYYNPATAYAQAVNNRSLYNGALLNSQFLTQFNNAAGFYTPNYASTPYSYPQTPYYPQMPYPTPYYPPSPYSGYGYGPQSYTQPTSPGTPTIDPYTGTPSTYPGASTLPYTPPYGSYGGNPYDPYGYGSYGTTLQGAASLTKSFGNLAISYEQARLMREQYNQMRIDTKKKQFEFDMYIKANTLTYTEEQSRIAKLTLRRIQTNSATGEIASGKSLNFLLDDVRKYPNKKTTVEPIMLSEEILRHLNVTRNTFAIGILREGGKFAWPAALHEMVKPDKREDLEIRVQNMVKDANREATKGRIDPNKLKDIRDEMDAIKTSLVNKVHDVPTTQYLDAKRFLQEFYEATVALERGDAPVQTKFSKFLDGGNKSIQDIVDYMITNGLRFGHATAQNDEAAYRTVHAALASYDIALNAQLAMGMKE